MLGSLCRCTWGGRGTAQVVGRLDLDTVSSLHQRFFTKIIWNQVPVWGVRVAKLLWNVDVVHWGIMSYSLSCEQGFKKERRNAGNTSGIRTGGYFHKRSAGLGVTWCTFSSISKPRSQWKTLIPHLGQVSIENLRSDSLRDPSISQSHSPPGSSDGPISISFCSFWSQSSSKDRWGRPGTFEASDVEAPWTKLRWHDSTHS